MHVNKQILLTKNTMLLQAICVLLWSIIALPWLLFYYCRYSEICMSAEKQWRVFFLADLEPK